MNIRRTSTVIIRKNKKNQYEVIHKFVGKNFVRVRKKFYFSTYYFKDGAANYAWLLAQDYHAVLIDLHDRTVKYY